VYSKAESDSLFEFLFVRT